MAGPGITGVRAEATKVGRPQAPSGRSAGGSIIKGVRADSAPAGGTDLGKSSKTPASRAIETVRTQGPTTDSSSTAFRKPKKNNY